MDIYLSIYKPEAFQSCVHKHKTFVAIFLDHQMCHAKKAALENILVWDIIWEVQRLFAESTMDDVLLSHVYKHLRCKKLTCYIRLFPLQSKYNARRPRGCLVEVLFWWYTHQSYHDQIWAVTNILYKTSLPGYS